VTRPVGEAAPCLVARERGGAFEQEVDHGTIVGNATP
jgi:hypothetical protein